MEETYSDNRRRARAAGWQSFLLLALVCSSLAGLLTGGLIFNYFTRSSFTPLQRFYFGQFVKSSFNKIGFSEYGKYELLAYQVVDEKTKKPVWRICLENQLVAYTDANGDIKYEENKFPAFRLKGEAGAIKNTYTFLPEKISHEWVRNFLAAGIYGSEFLELFYPGFAGAGFAFVLTFAGMNARRNKGIDKFLKGKFRRGTKLLNPKTYLREMKKEADGFGVKVVAADEENFYAE